MKIEHVCVQARMLEVERTTKRWRKLSESR